MIIVSLNVILAWLQANHMNHWLLTLVHCMHAAPGKNGLRLYCMLYQFYSTTLSHNSANPSLSRISSLSMPSSSPKSSCSLFMFPDTSCSSSASSSSSFSVSSSSSSSSTSSLLLGSGSLCSSCVPKSSSAPSPSISCG